ncbi:MAG: ABC transporter substrate-binding protein [Lawsonibacter sp.]
MKKYLAMLLASAMTVSLLAGCGSSSDSSSGSNGGTSSASSAGGASSSASSTGSNSAFKLGGTGPLTGGASIYGLAAQRGALIAVEEIKEAGGDVQFELRYEDDQHDPEKAVNAYNTLKSWGMQISLGSVTSKPGEATSVLNNEDRIFALTPSASSPAVIEGKDNVYQMCFTDDNQGLASAQYISEQGLGEKVFIIWKNDDVYSTGIKNQFVAEAEALGLTVVGDATFTEDTQNDFSVQLTQAQQNGADLLFLPMYYQPASLILSQAKAMGYTPKFFGVDGMDGILTMEGFDASLAEGVMLLTPFNADAEDEATKNFVAKYQEQYGEVPNQFAADAYDCVYAFKLALETSGCTPDMSAEDICAKLMETFPTITFEGLTGDGAGITWDSTGAVSKSPKGMIIQNGAYVGMD